MIAQSIKNLLCCVGIASVTLASCKKADNSTAAPFSEGYYTGRVISNTVQDGGKVQTVLPANISFAAGNYSANNVPVNLLATANYIPFNGTYEVQAGNTALVLTYVKSQLVPLTGPGFLTGQFTIAYQADSLILTQSLPDGLSSYQFRLKKFVR